MKRLLSTILLMVCLALPASAKTPLPAVLVAEPPRIDGDLSDECWATAVKITEFYHLESVRPALEQTTAWIAYDGGNIYVAFDCRDSEPERIRSQQKKRGGNMDADDSVILMLDPFSENREIALNRFQVNTLGTRSHSVQSSETGKTEWIGDWDAAVKRNSDGYSVEMRIPLAMIRYNHRNPNISLAFVRRHARHRQEWWAPNIGNTGDYSDMYLWDGLVLEAIRPRPVTLLYTLIGAESGESSQRLGLDFKHSLTPGVTGLFTINPDFRNIEQDIDSVDFAYTERVLPDSRPFFSEGQQYFPNTNVYYSRNIGEIDTGVKLVGVHGDYKLAFMNARRFNTDESYYVGQIGRQFGPNGDLTIWLGSVFSETAEIDNFVGFSTIRYKWRQRQGRQNGVSYTYTSSDSADRTGRGRYAEYEFWSTSGPRKLEYSLVHSIIDPDFDPYLGADMDKGLRLWNPLLVYWDAPQKGVVSRWQIGVLGRFADHLTGDRLYNSVEPFVYADFRDGRRAEIWYNHTNRPPFHDEFWTLRYGWRENDLYRAGALDYSIGIRAGGDYTYGSIKQGFHLSDRLNAQVWYDYRRISEPSPFSGKFYQTVLSASYDIDAEKAIVARWVRRTGQSNLYFAYRQRVRSGLDAYLIYGDPNSIETRDVTMLKLVRPL